MAQKEIQQKHLVEQEEFAPRSCYILTEEYFVTVYCHSKNWQSVTVYSNENGKRQNLSHMTFSIDVNKEKKSCLIDYNKQDLPEELLTDMILAEYIYSIVYDTMLWMEFWREENLDDEQREVEKFWNQQMSEIIPEK